MIIYFSDFLIITLVASGMVLLSSIIAAKRTDLISTSNSIVLEK